ncbi:MAG: M3 family metallopeptidase [Paludibacter sp.]|nr:M3 family metallopeptidase [Bacteroidales bacterium]MCM1068903.1 M3 family metallopeptidase [Prevotella sp.]MCM1353164.1 M3 family metallopeptidase [Bacteroides sp.]MCM1442486.1 M3 family metallopeptidase [Muribaculum sp.]MCM1481329.1 M3 family metallopeptidase [Paludibacter sp.]
MKLKHFALMAFTACSVAVSATNPFFEYKNWKTPHGTYPFNEIRPEHYMPAFEEGMRQGLQDIDDIVNNPAAPTFANTIEAYEKSGRLLSVVASCFYNLTSAETNDELQAIEMELSPKLSEYSATIRLNEKLFQRIKAVYEQRDKLKLNKEQRKLLDDVYESFANNGANLSPEDKQTYRELSARLSQLTLTYGQNVLKATNAWTMLVTNESDLAGVSDDTKAMLRANAEKKGLEGWLLDLKPTTYIPVMQDCDNRDIRRELYMAYNSRCIGGEFDNTSVICDIVNTRLALANLFGKATYADKSLHKTMAETKENVYKLLDQLRDAYMPVAKEEVAELQAFATANGFYAELQGWDWSYWSKKLKNEKYAVSDDLLRPYFELENVKQGVFGLAKRLYGITFKENKDIQVYNPEVSAYEVFDEKGKFLAVYYADFHPREGKRGGAWMNDFKPQWKEGKLDSRPHIVNVMNFTRPTADKPALLTYDEVETFLHEFGHGLHGMLTRCQYASLSGTNVPRDFVELPSQFNENFLGEKEFLDTFAKHWQTGEPMPQELIDKIKASQTYHSAYACVRQLSFGYLDMAWHTLEQPFAPSECTTTMQAVIDFGNEAMEQVQVLPIVPGTQMETAFTHIFSGGYAAGYYSYKWSELLDADAFSVLKKNGIFDKKTANLFRTCILERGGTENPMELYKRFRGGEPTINALMERDGIKAIVLQ